MEHFEQSINNGFSSEQRITRSNTEIELAFELDQALIPWINDHQSDFDELIKNSPEILNELADEKTHREAFEKVKKAIYH